MFHGLRGLTSAELRWHVALLGVGLGSLKLNLHPLCRLGMEITLVFSKTGLIQLYYTAITHL